MSFIAPNLSNVLGPTVAAKLMGKLVHVSGITFAFSRVLNEGVAGGLVALSKIPSCNILVSR